MHKKEKEGKPNEIFFTIANHVAELWKYFFLAGSVIIPHIAEDM